jgi:thioredoxin-related protein
MATTTLHFWMYNCAVVYQQVNSGSQSFWQVFRVVLAGIIVLLTAGFHPAPEQFAPLDWRTANEASLLARTFDKKILVWIYTDWCGYCHLMEKKALSDPRIVDLINLNYFPVRLNAERKDRIEAFGTSFKYLPEKKVHELAYVLMNGRTQYPSIIILNREGEILTPIQGYVEADTLKPILTFYSRNLYKTMTWSEYKSAVTE